jgi:hypothetical protein
VTEPYTAKGISKVWRYEGEGGQKVQFSRYVIKERSHTLHCNTLCVDQLKLVVSIIPIWISPALLNFLVGNFLDIIRID